MTDDLKTSERLREIILDLERANTRERESRLETEVLLSGLKLLSECKRKEDIFKNLLEVLKGAIGFEHAFLLVEQENRTYKSITSSSPRFSNTSWENGSFFNRVASGRPIALFDVHFVPEWSTQESDVKADTIAALHVPIHDDSRRAILIFTHSTRGFFNENHVQLAARFAPLAAQALANFNRISELEEVNSRLQEEIRVRQIAENLAERRQNLMINNTKMAALGEMAGGVAHEINNPLAIITALSEQVCELVTEESLDTQSIKEAVESINKTAVRITKIVKGLRAFSRNDAKDPYSSATVKSIIDEILVLCREKLKLAGISLKFEIDRPELSIHCRPTQISQVILNLLNNSYDAIQSLPEKWIQISITDLRDKVEIAITDSGNGIPDHIRQKLFQPFFTTKEIGKGTGLGLSISKGLIEGHNGTLSVDEACRNTRFLIHLPVHPENQKSNRQLP